MTARGHAVVWNRILQDTSLSRDGRLLFAILDGLPPEADGTKVVTYSQLATMLGVSRSTAQRRVMELGWAGLISWTRGGTRGGSRRPNRYLLLEIVPRRGKRGDVALEVAAQPQTEPLHVGRVSGAELAQEPGVGMAPTTPRGTRSVAGGPHTLHRGLRVHGPDLSTTGGVSGVSRNGAGS